MIRTSTVPVINQATKKTKKSIEQLKVINRATKTTKKTIIKKLFDNLKYNALPLKTRENGMVLTKC